MAFRALGAEAYSCDLQPCSGGHPEWHIQGDVLAILQAGQIVTQAGSIHTIPQWDLMIAHPPCTYLTRAGATLLYPGGHLCWRRYRNGLLARRFFMTLLTAPISHIAVENPTPCLIYHLPPPSMVLHPKDYGEQWTKRTLLWLRNLPPLMYGCEHPSPRSYVYHCYHHPRRRSKSFTAVAAAMAEQWLPLL